MVRLTRDHVSDIAVAIEAEALRVAERVIHELQPFVRETAAFVFEIFVLADFDLRMFLYSERKLYIIYAKASVPHTLVAGYAEDVGAITKGCEVGGLVETPAKIERKRHQPNLRASKLQVRIACSMTQSTRGHFRLYET